jgi:hypothetical protein
MQRDITLNKTVSSISCHVTTAQQLAQNCPFSILLIDRVAMTSHEMQSIIDCYISPAGSIPQPLSSGNSHGQHWITTVHTHSRYSSIVSPGMRLYSGEHGGRQYCPEDRDMSFGNFATLFKDLIPGDVTMCLFGVRCQSGSKQPSSD